MLDAILIFISMIAALSIGMALVLITLTSAHRREAIQKKLEQDMLHAESVEVANQVERLDLIREQGF